MATKRTRASQDSRIEQSLQADESLVDFVSQANSMERAAASQQAAEAALSTLDGLADDQSPAERSSEIQMRALLEAESAVRNASFLEGPAYEAQD